MAWSALSVPSSSPPRLVVVRHGATEWSSSGRHTGRTDIPLTTEGEAQARALAPRLAGLDVARVLTSPLARARMTCALAGFGGRAEPDPDLAEWDYGRYDGLTRAEIRAQRPDWDLWADGPPGGETIDQVAARAGRVVAAVAGGSGDVIAFAHGHVLRIVATCWLGVDPRQGRLLRFSPTGVGVLAWENERPVLSRWNDDGGPFLR